MNSRPFLLDVNVLLALAFPNHIHHRSAKRWLEQHVSYGIRTCPFTEAGFVRISSNAALGQSGVSVLDAIRIIRALRQLPHYDFWPADISVAEMPSKNVFGHRQLTDAYLVALAVAHEGRLATFDRAIPQLALDPASVQLIPH